MILICYGKQFQNKNNNDMSNSGTFPLARRNLHKDILSLPIKTDFWNFGFVEYKHCCAIFKNLRKIKYLSEINNAQTIVIKIRRRKNRLVDIWKTFHYLEAFQKER